MRNRCERVHHFRLSPVFGLGHGVADAGGADQRVLGQASVEW